jgi:ubiquinone/menaquinone biosynthesis C-methylase UbiE
MQNNYDPLAKYYDFLSRLAFGQTEVRAQVEMLSYTKPGDRILIVGGGTGWILDELAAIHPRGLQITYVESSNKMLEAARRRSCGENEVSFVLTPVERFVSEGLFDCILTGFLFDNFCKARCWWIIQRLSAQLKHGGHWLFADFYYSRKDGRLWQRLLLRFMYWLVRLTCHIEANELVDTEPMFASVGFREVQASYYYRRFIKSIVYIKN